MPVLTRFESPPWTDARLLAEQQASNEIFGNTKDEMTTYNTTQWGLVTGLSSTDEDAIKEITLQLLWYVSHLHTRIKSLEAKTNNSQEE